MCFCRAMRMHKRGLCRHALCGVCLCVCVCVSVCLSVCLSRSWVVSKRIKISSKFFSPSGRHTILVFPYQMGWRYSNGNPSNGGVEYRWGRQKTRFWTNIWLHCIQVYSVVNRTSREVWMTKPRWTAASVENSPRRPSFVVRTRRRRSVCDRLNVIRRRWREVNPPGHNPRFLLL